MKAYDFKEERRGRETVKILEWYKETDDSYWQHQVVEMSL